MCEIFFDNISGPLPNALIGIVYLVSNFGILGSWWRVKLSFTRDYITYNYSFAAFNIEILILDHAFVLVDNEVLTHASKRNFLKKPECIETNI